MFDLKILSKDRKIYQDAVNRVRVEGEDSDYEIMSFHADVAGILRRGKIVIDNKYKVRIRRGLVSFHNNQCICLVEEAPRKKRTAA